LRHDYDNALPRLPNQPADTIWPTHEWPAGKLNAKVDQARLSRLIDFAFADRAPTELNETHALLIVQNGKIVTERYWRDFKPSDTYQSWSMAKSITHALVGILVREGKLKVKDKADIAAWQSDDRRNITLDQLLRMSSGLHFVEDYVDDKVSDVIEMLFGSGKEDVAAYAINQELDHPPGSHWSYSSGTTNIVTQILKQVTGLGDAAFTFMMQQELFMPIGMGSADPRYDLAGTFIGSSFCYCTARDFARFGMLYLRDGVWDGQRILPEGWVDYARTPTETLVDHDALDYGAHWWLGLGGPGSFSCNGYQGQFIVVVPDLDLIVVRHGDSINEQTVNVRKWIGEVVECFR
jgi:CubicO group peptidase (beta-lactamase class C family)